MEDKERTGQKPAASIHRHPKENANFFTTLFFCWTIPLFRQGFKKDLTEDDLYGPLKKHESQRLGDQLEQAWFHECNRSRNPSLWRAIIRVFGKDIAFYGIVFIINELIKLANPILLGRLMDYYRPHQTDITKNQAYIYAGLLVMVVFIAVLITHNYVFGLMHIGMRVRVACCSLIYRKALRLSKSALAETTVGQMVNLLSNDVSRFDYTFIHFHNLWLAPLETFIIIYLLYGNVGPSAIAGIGILVLFIPLQLYLGKRSSVYRMRTALKTDNRVRLMNEIITGIQVIKMYTWEKPFAKLVELARKAEIHQIRYASYLRAINFSFVLFLNRTSIFLCVLTHILTGNQLNAAYVYIVTAFYGNLRQALTMFVPQGLTALAETNISVRRIQKVLMFEELYQDDLQTLQISGKQSKIGVYMENITVKWVQSSNDYTLHDINFNANSKQLVAIVGSVGSGKTTLLHVILKELKLLKGRLEVDGRISYASQEPWLFAGSIKQNILFGEPMDVKKYQRIIKVCALERDLSLFPYGDRTIIGERGVMLSGGQKARINLARAVYKDADIYLLDDPLSAVDTHVGKQLFDDCIVDYLKDKCTILITHQLQYLKTVDRIYLLENGRIKLYDGDFVGLLRNKFGENNNIEDNCKLEILKKSEEPNEIKEHKSKGTVSRDVYKKYIKAGGGRLLSLSILILFILTQIIASTTDYFLTIWINLEQKTQNNSTISVINQQFTQQNCIIIYTILLFGVILFTLTRSLSIFKFCLNASQQLHNLIFTRIVNAPMRFFNTNPSGRILNRFSKDIGGIDETLPMTIADTLFIGLTVISVTILVAIINPWFIIPTIILSGIFYIYKIVFLATSRNLKRLEGITKSPIFTHLSASVQGLTTIRALRAQDILKNEFDQHQDGHTSVFYMFAACTHSFGFWLDFNCVIYIGLVIFSFLLIGNETYAGNVGLAITQAITLTGMLQWGMRQWSELENQMTSVERVIEYTEIPQEIDSTTIKPSLLWPEYGNIEFNKVSLRYSLEDTFVLKDLSFKINDSEKIGIVGRTGAGKSSIISALFRLTSHISGEIIIDDINTAKIRLDDLRSKISIIPQEPFLFSGTLRKNLDPFDEYPDDTIWKALEEVELKHHINDLPYNLNSLVSEGGANFSVGQRQLLCLARAVIRSNKILILDEATANIDPQTDELIQKTIRKKFQDCTVLTIAHRLHTVMDSDKILVLDAGEIIEFDSPYNLLQNQNGLFYNLVSQTGRQMAGNLTKITEESFKGKSPSNQL